MELGVYTFAELNDQGPEARMGYATMMNRIGRDRGWAPMERQSFEALRKELDRTAQNTAV